MPPPEEAVEERRSSQYVSGKDLKWIAGIVLVIALLFYPIFQYFKEQGEIQRCSSNLKSIGEALQQYAIDNNDRLPPSYTASATDAPALENGLPVAWSTQIEPHMNPRATFVCPTASSDESAIVLSGRSGRKSTLLNYGMYKGLSTVPTGMVPQPTESVLIAETSNFGSATSYNPKPFTDEEGKQTKIDGFLIGWDDSNTLFTDKTTRVTRLAFRGSTNGFGGKNVQGRHKDFIHAISVDGGLLKLVPSDTKVSYLHPVLQGAWWANPQLVR